METEKNRTPAFGETDIAGLTPQKPSLIFSIGVVENNVPQSPFPVVPAGLVRTEVTFRI